MPHWVKYLLLVFLLLFLAALPLAMQFESGAIEGLIIDQFGPVPGASVQASHSMSGAMVHARSDAGGKYRVQNLRAGQYSLWVEAPGHDSLWLRVVIVNRGLTTRQDLRLTRISIPTDR